MESKRLGRTLPAVIQGLSACQAQTQGHVQDISEADTTSTANDESLFLDGESDNEKLEVPSKLTSLIQKDLSNDEAVKLSSAATPFISVNSPKPGSFSSSNAFQSTTFGKPSTIPITTTAQTDSWPSSNLTLADTAQLNSFSTTINNPSKFDIPVFLKTTNKADEDIKAATLSSAGESVDSRDVDSLMESPANKPQFATSDFFGNPQTAARNSLIPPVNLSDQPLSTMSRGPSPSQIMFEKSPRVLAMPSPPSSTFPLFETSAPNLLLDNDAIGSSSDPNDKSKAPAITNSSNPSISLAPQDPSTNLPNQSPLDSDKHFNSIFSGATSYTTLGGSMLKHSEIPEAEQSFLPLKSNANAPFQTQLDAFSSKTPKNSSIEAETENISQPKASHETLPVTSPSLRSQGYPGTAPQRATSYFSSNNALSSSPAIGHLPKIQVKFQSGRTGSRPDALDQLSEALMLENKGLLQQFIEYTIEPIIESSLAQLDDENSWKKASQSLLRMQYYLSNMLTWVRGVSDPPTKQEILS